MSEKLKSTAEDLNKRVEDLEKMLGTYKDATEDKIRSKPLESVGIVLLGGVLLGVLIGMAVSRRS
jgi:ElaB/YqjD/DUF883 family membrane-anchored ribosome-binding protein